jgi:hypothetical protein
MAVRKKTCFELHGFSGHPLEQIYNEKGKDAAIGEIKNLQHDNLDNLHNLYNKIGVKGFEEKASLPVTKTTEAAPIQDEQDGEQPSISDKNGTKFGIEIIKDESGRVTSIKAIDKTGEFTKNNIKGDESIADFSLTPKQDGTYYPQGLSVNKELQRRGIATALFDYAEKKLGLKLTESTDLSDDGQAFVDSRNKKQNIIQKPKVRVSAEQVEAAQPKKEAKVDRKALSDQLRTLLGNGPAALNRQDTNPQSRVSFEDIGITENDTVDQAIDKLIAYGGEFTDILKDIKQDGNLSKVNLQVVQKLEGGESGLYHPQGHGEGKDGLLQISDKGNTYYTAAHELLHFFTLDSAAAEQVKNTASYKGLEDMYNYIAAKKGKPIAGTATVESYGLTNVKEFMAELLINPTFRNYVSDVFAENKEDVLKSSKNLRDSKVTSIGDLVLNFFKDLFAKVFSGSKGINIDTNQSVIDNAARVATDLFFGGKDVTVGQTKSGEGGTVLKMGEQRAAALAFPSADNSQ